MRNNQPVSGVEHPMPGDQSLISRTDTKGKITYVNQAFVEMSGFSENELLGEPHNIVRHPDMPAEAFADLWTTLKTGNSWTGMVKNRRKNGDHYWVLANATPILENGAVVGYTSVRTAPSRQQIDATARMYARFKEGRARGLAIRHGKVVRKGLLGKIASLKNLHIRGRLMAVMLMLCLCMIGVGMLGMTGMHQANQRLNTVYEDRAIPLGQLDMIVRLLNINRLGITTALIKQDQLAATASAKEIEGNLERVGATWQAYTATRLTPEEKSLADQFAADRGEFLQKGLLPAVAALKAGDLAQARKLELEVLPALFAPVRRGIDSLIQLQLDVARQEAEQARVDYIFMRNTMIALIIFGTLVSCFLALYLVRSIVRPLNEAVSVAKQIAAGNLTATIVATSDDEVGQMLHTLNVMKKSLTNIISGVRGRADIMGQSSGEIAAGNADLSQRTEEQASALEETASSMEELTSTVKHNADNSKAAKIMAHSACDIAVRGGNAMEQVVGTMDSIADSSRKITDIISVIDGIAFQTNILALNAAVEAARAGEQGRGFAVVASEVRNLAHRSAAAAKEINGLISNSVAKVEDGAKQVTEARKTMDDIVEAVQKVTDIMSEITAASDEQSSGINQVCQAVMQMDQVTQQNAALVEQAAAAAESMQDQCASLVQEVGVFKIGR